MVQYCTTVVLITGYLEKAVTGTSTASCQLSDFFI